MFGLLENKTFLCLACCTGPASQASVTFVKIFVSMLWNNKNDKNKTIYKISNLNKPTVSNSIKH